MIITGIPLSSNSTIQYPNIDTTVGNEFTNPQWGLAISETDMKEMGIPATISSVRVTKVLKGNISPNSTINIVQLGGTINGINIRDDTSVLLDEIHSAEDQLLLLLSATGNKQYSIISPNAGILSVNSGGYISPFKTLDKTLYESSLNSYYDLIDRNTHDQRKQ